MDLVRQEKLDMAVGDTTNRDRSLHFRKLGQRDFCVALPQNHPLCKRDCVEPQDVLGLPQVVFNSDVEHSFNQWASGAAAEDSVCTVNTAQAALELVAEGVGVCILSRACARPVPGVKFVPLANWHQALYMCILYDKWLEPPIWSFVDNLVKVLRKTEN